MNLIYNGKKAKLDGNHLFTTDLLTKNKLVIHISDIQKEYYDNVNFVELGALVDFDKLYELKNILDTHSKL